ncbi:DUF1294 domain-containing protein [Peribacillus deserti]|uniref:DUF1294 domain-containing protein n=1 Tax=Peribacillus deserti TaxID=673318 RepID=A0A2N5MA59_9BACI|nr:DUF1294 domain-containing protein [Peribacillus deserti]PLT31203.1 DUF1294 domain-containing protein [Peribacillus deserti]
MKWFYILTIYGFIINVISLITMKVDKERARKHQYRIAESTLWLMAAAGGSIGATLGMNLFRHKTKHLSFRFGFPMLVVIHLFLLFTLVK